MKYQPADESQPIIPRFLNMFYYLDYVTLDSYSFAITDFTPKNIFGLYDLTMMFSLLM